MARTAATLTALRAQLKTADPHRPAVDRMPRAEVEFLLAHIAEGGMLWAADDDEPALPLTRASLDKAASARGTKSMDVSDAWVAGFLAFGAGL